MLLAAELSLGLARDRHPERFKKAIEVYYSFLFYRKKKAGG
jgi:hypothetical protein